MDIETRAKAAGAAARTEARHRAGTLERPDVASRARRNVRPALLAVAGCLAAVVVASTLLSQPDTARVPAIDPVAPPAPAPGEPLDPVADDGVLPVPEVGDAIPAHLDDGTPVFVSHPADGEVVVLNAVDPHTTLGIGKLVAYCESSAWFEDLFHGSRFTGWGDWTGGPSPTGLASFPSELAEDGATVQVVGAADPAPARDEPRGPDQSPQGPSCDTGDTGDTGHAAARMHTVPDAGLELDGRAVRIDRWVWTELVVGGYDDLLVVCDLDGTCDERAPTVDGAAMAGEYRGIDPGAALDAGPNIYLARSTPQGTIDLIVPAEPADAGLFTAIWPAPDKTEAEGEVSKTDLDVGQAPETRAGPSSLATRRNPRRPRDVPPPSPTGEASRAASSNGHRRLRRVAAGRLRIA